MQRIFSGIQPTGIPTLGNYLGAVRNWTKLQDDHDCIYCVVDLHAITAPHDPKTLAQATREMVAALIASGIDPKRSILFHQSAVWGTREEVQRLRLGQSRLNGQRSRVHAVVPEGVLLRVVATVVRRCQPPGFGACALSCHTHSLVGDEPPASAPMISVIPRSARVSMVLWR